jgi:replicative DNA helicase
MGAEIHRIQRGMDDIPATYSVEAEQIVIGTALMEPGILAAIQRAGGGHLFFEPVHARIYEVVAEKDRAQMLVSPITVAAVMEGDIGLASLGGPAYLARLAGAASGTMARGYLEMLSDMRAKRRMVAAMAEAREAITQGDEPAAKIAGRLEAAALEASSAAGNAGPVSMMRAAVTAIDQVSAAYQGEDGDVVRTGIIALDRLLGGFYPGELILLGGRPSMGKTAVALSIATRAAKAGNHVAIASLEMNPEAMAMRAISEATAEAGCATAYADMRRGAITEAQMRATASAARAVADLPVTFLPRHYSDIGALMAGAKQIHRTAPGGLRLLVVDYAQLLRSSARNRFEQITEISIALKALAGRLNVPVLALSQLSRAVEQRDDKRPTLADLRESGQLEQDADTVLFCFRHEYYLERERPEDDDAEAVIDWGAAMEAARNRLDIIVAKQRQGEIGTAKVRFNPATNLIWEDGR